MEYVFISYSSKNKAVADGVCHYLEENGIRCWIAPRDIPVGKDYGDLIDEAICGCAAAVLVFSTPASVSKWVKGEINLAFTEGKPILPFRIEEAQIKGSFRVMLNQMHWIDAFPQYADKLPDLLSSLQGLLHLDAKEEKVRINATAPLSEPQAAPPVRKDEIFNVNGVKFKMVYVEGGTFMMGATAEQGNDAYDDKKPVHKALIDYYIVKTAVSQAPVHKVTLSDYYIGETVVTQALWKAVMRVNPLKWRKWKDSNLPVNSVSWNDAQKFIRKLNAKTGRTFRLPTEAEWEYAARGGGKSKGYKYSGSNNIDEVAWYYDNSGKQTHAVKGKRANELGLYDMSGNVWEWCADWKGSYGSSPQTDPKGPGSGDRRVLRGGSWSYSAGGCRVSYRYGDDPAFRDNYFGFRLVLCL